MTIETLAQLNFPFKKYEKMARWSFFKMSLITLDLTTNRFKDNVCTFLEDNLYQFGFLKIIIDVVAEKAANERPLEEIKEYIQGVINKFVKGLLKNKQMNEILRVCLQHIKDDYEAQDGFEKDEIRNRIKAVYARVATSNEFYLTNHKNDVIGIIRLLIETNPRFIEVSEYLTEKTIKRSIILHISEDIIKMMAKEAPTFEKLDNYVTDMIGDILYAHFKDFDPTSIKFVHNYPIDTSSSFNFTLQDLVTPKLLDIDFIRFVNFTLINDTDVFLDPIIEPYFVVGWAPDIAGTYHYNITYSNSNLDGTNIAQYSSIFELRVKNFVNNHSMCSIHCIFYFIALFLLTVLIIIFIVALRKYRKLVYSKVKSTQNDEIELDDAPTDEMELKESI